MPIDPRIIAGISPAATFDPIAAQKVANDAAEVKMRGDLLRQKFADEQRARQDDLMARQALSEAQGDPKKAIPLLLQRGLVGPATALQDQVNKNEKAKAETDKAQIDTALNHTEYVSQLLQGATEKTYPLLRNMLASSLGPDAANELPEQYDPEAVNALVMSGRKAADVLREKKDQIDAYFKGQEIGLETQKIGETALHDRATENAAIENIRAANARAAAALAETSSYHKGELGIAAGRLALDKQKAADAAAGKGADAVKVPASIAESVSGAEQGLAAIADLRNMKDVNDYIGPLQGRVNQKQLEYLSTTDKKLADLNTRRIGLFNNYVKAMTGAQMSEPEARRLGMQIPQLSDTPTVWKAKIDAMEKDLIQKRHEMLRLSGGSALEVPMSEVTGQKPKRYNPATDTFEDVK